MSKKKTDESVVGWSRRDFMLAASGVALPLLTGCGLSGSRSEPAVLRVGLCDALSKNTPSQCVGEYAKREYEGLANVLEREAGVHLKFRLFPIDEQLISAAGRGELDALICKTWTMLRAGVASPSPYHRLADIPGPEGKDLHGVFIARKDSPIRTLGDIDGRSFAVGSESQYESSFQARRDLAEAGVRPARTTTIASCLNVAAKVWEGGADAGVVSDYCVDHSGLQLVGDPEAFRILGRTDPVPFITVAVSTEVPAPVRARAQTALLSMAGSRVPEDLETTGVVQPRQWRPGELGRL